LDDDSYLLDSFIVYGISAAIGKLGAIVSQAGLLQIKDSFGGRDSGIPVLFGIFSGFMFVGFLVTFLIPETKGRSLEAISKETDSFGDVWKVGVLLP
jgi:PHS family inorganic phosphate transporter-like MFS transporter